MAYVSEWERLPEVTERVMTAANLSKDQAQTQICQAIADGVVNFRSKLRWHPLRRLRASNTLLQAKDFHIPTKIQPEDLDWEKSRPVKPWSVRRGAAVHWGDWELEWIELSSTDVTNVLCMAVKRGDSAQRASRETGATKRSKPKFVSVKRAIDELYPEGVPGQAAVRNKELCRRIAEKLKKDGLPPVKDDTILRAAGRRK